MFARKLVAAFAVLGIMTVSGVAVSGAGRPVTLLNFEESSQLLYAVDGDNRIGVFQHGPFTNHLPGYVINGIPPDPCHGFINAYNAQISRVRADAPRTSMLVIISHLSAAHCEATIDADANGNLLSFQPHH